MFQLAKGYGQSGMSAYAQLQQEEFAAEKDGYTATKHQREVSNSVQCSCFLGIPSSQKRQHQ